jgi:hypothetical protein
VGCTGLRRTRACSADVLDVPVGRTLLRAIEASGDSKTKRGVERQGQTSSAVQPSFIAGEPGLNAVALEATVAYCKGIQRFQR